MALSCRRERAVNGCNNLSARSQRSQASRDASISNLLPPSSQHRRGNQSHDNSARNSVVISRSLSSSSARPASIDKEALDSSVASTVSQAMERIHSKTLARSSLFAHDSTMNNLMNSTLGSTMSSFEKSNEVPLRSIFLDPSINPFPPSKTRTELLKKLRASYLPHPSYDLNGRGTVSQEDYRNSRRFDIDGDGILSDDERTLAKYQLATEFFANKTAEELSRIDPNLSAFSSRTNSNLLFTSNKFEREYDALRKKDRSVHVKGSYDVDQCLKLTNNGLIKYNFFANKFDTTAWNDFDAIPRSASSYGLDDHGGSRKRLMFSRRQVNREDCQRKMIDAEQHRPEVFTRRINLITNPAIENS